MTDNEIIKALECCLDCNCKECPCCRIINGGTYCTEIDEEAILNLINRQKVEIERLKLECYKLYPKGSAYSMQVEASNRLEHQIKSEAIKECLAKVKNYIKTHCNPYGKPDFDYDTSIKILNCIDLIVATSCDKES